MRHLTALRVGTCLLVSLVVVLYTSCSEFDPATGTTSTTTTSVPPPPVLLSSNCQINRSAEGQYSHFYYIGWSFTVRSSHEFDDALVQIWWWTAEYRAATDVWVGVIERGTRTYEAETMMEKHMWHNIVRWEIEIRP
jgi:hypothetical protein